MEPLCHYRCRVRHRDQLIFVVWRSNEHDDFLRDANGHLLTAPDLESLAATMRALGLQWEEVEPIEYDFDRIREWCAAPDAAGVDCPAFLNAWNFFDDLSRSLAGTDTPYGRLSRNAEERYDRLFWGSNLPAMTPSGCRFGAVWSAEDLSEIRLVMLAGLKLVETELRGSRN